jgi:hypothetical protein
MVSQKMVTHQWDDNGKAHPERSSSKALQAPAKSPKGGVSGDMVDAAAAQYSWING